jgi:hypothetical protein
MERIEERWYGCTVFGRMSIFCLRLFVRVKGVVRITHNQRGGAWWILRLVVGILPGNRLMSTRRKKWRGSDNNTSRGHWASDGEGYL